MKYFHLLAALFLSIFNEVAYSKCLPKADFIPECRYEKGDLWCAQHGKGNLYAYSDNCLRDNSNHSGQITADVSGLKALRQGMNYSKARQIIINAGWQGKKKRWQMSLSMDK